MRKTLISNVIVVSVIIYAGVLYKHVPHLEKWSGFIFYSIIGILFFTLFFYVKEPKSAILKIEDSKLKVQYIFPSKGNESFFLYKISGLITVERYREGELMGGLPNIYDYLNFRWYFTTETYEISFLYDGYITSFEAQVNIIGFKKFLLTLVNSLNSINKDRIVYIETSSSKIDLAETWISIVFKNIF